MKKILCFLLSLIMLFCLPVAAGATDDFDLGQNWDDSILAGGIYDLFVWVGNDADDYTYQWQVDLGMGDGRWSDLEDNANPYGYAGTKTYHMQLITPRTNGYIIGSGWEDIPFRCVVTQKKTGVSKSTPNIYMQVFTSDDLEEYMAKKGVELYTPTVTGGSKATTSDDKTYYATAEAGKSLEFICGFKPPQNDPLMGRSDMAGNVEVWVTENGKTVKGDGSVFYTPYTIGKDAVTVQFKLHYTLGIHDLGYYEVKTLKLSTGEPTVIGRGTAKQEMSLLKEPYSQSQKLVTIPKGQSVRVHSNSGSWYQVSYNGYVGYVAGSNLNYEDYTPVIDHVDVSIPEPVAGAIPATTCSITPNSCYVTSVEWEDKTEGRYMDPGEKFQKGHSYQLVVWATAKDGYEFKLDANDKMLTTAIINGNLPAFTSRAYEQIIGKVIDIRYDFNNVKEKPQAHVCKLTPVPKVEPTCTKPGCEAYYFCECGMHYSDSQGKNAVDVNTWGKIPALGHLETVYQSDANMHFKFCGRPTCGEELTQFRGNHTGGNASCKEGGKCTVCGYAYLEPTDHKWSPKYHPVDANGHAYQCAECKSYDTIVPHTPGPEATDTEPQKCTECDYILQPAKNHIHQLTMVEGIEATCLTPGVLGYFSCSGCEEWFQDQEGKIVIEDHNSLILPALGHFSEDWKYGTDSHWQECVVCSEKLTEENPHQFDEEGTCSVCGYVEGTSVQTENPDMPTVTDKEKTEKSPKSYKEDEKPDGKKWYLLPILFVIVFGLTLTVTVIIVKKKRS